MVVNEDKKYKEARKLALEIARKAQTSGSETSLKRKEIRSLGVNPTCRVEVDHRTIIRGEDSAQKWIDSQSNASKNKKELVAAVQKLSKGEKLSEAETALVQEEAKKSEYLRQSLSMYGKEISSSSSQKMDISETVTSWSISKSMEIGGGVLTMTCMVDKHNTLRSVENGDKFFIYLEDELVFWGICMKISTPNEWDIEFTVNDPMWYLKNGLVWVQNEKMTLTQAFVNICEELGLPYEKPNLPKICDLKPRVETNTTAMSILQELINETLVKIQKQYAIRMNPDKLELIDLEGVWEGNTLKQQGTQFDVVEAMTQFNATKSIEDQTYTELNVYTNISNRLKSYFVQDLAAMEKYGVLRYQEVLNNAIIREEQLDAIISVCKYETSELDFSIMGVINILPCDSIRLCDSIYLVSSVDYRYDNDGYSIDIKCARWQKPNPDKVGGENWNFVEQYEQMKRSGSEK